MTDGPRRPARMAGPSAATSIEVLGRSCATIFVSCKVTTVRYLELRTARSTGYIIDVTEESDFYNVTVPQPMTPFVMSFLPFLISILAPPFSLLGDVFINTAARYLLAIALLPTITVVKRLLVEHNRNVVRATESNGKFEAPGTMLPPSATLPFRSLFTID